MHRNLPFHLSVILTLVMMLSCQTLFAQGTIKGSVSASSGEGLAGTAVMIEGLQIGAFADDAGNYSIADVPAGTAVVVAQMYGYKTAKQKVTVANGQTVTVNFSMQDSISSTDEVVVVGYGVQRQRDLVGSIAKITKVNDNVGNSFETQLQGKAAGVQITQSSGAAGAGAVVRVRGLGSISAGGDPLYVVDGMPITQEIFVEGASNNRGGQNNNPLAFINPNDIESIEVLKDASATGIYGSRGANGVILVTTKRGKGDSKKLKFDFSARQGVSNPTKVYRMLNSTEWLQLRQEAWENDGHVGKAPLPRGMSWEDAQKNNTNWVDQTVAPGFKQEYNLSAAKGGKKFRTYTGLSYLNDRSYLKGNSYVRYTGRVNMDYDVSKNFKITANNALSRGQNNRVSQAWEAGGFGAALSTLLPIYPVNSTLLGADDPNFRREHRSWQTIEWHNVSNVAATYTPVKGLDIRATGNYDFVNSGDNIYEDSLYDRTSFIARGKQYLTKTRNWTTNLTAQYQVPLQKDHSLLILGGTEAQKSVARYNELELTNVDGPLNLSHSALGDKKIDTLATIKPVQAWTFLSYFTRVNYNYKGKYFIQPSARIDGSSRFGSNNRYGFFPSVGAGYVISEENFLKGNKVLNFLKLRGSWGLTGSSAIPNYARYGTYSSGGNSTTYGDGTGNGMGSDTIIFPTNYPNPNLSWEKTRTVDAGLEIGLWNDRITMNIGVYDKRTQNMLINSTIQASAAAGQTQNGFTRYYQNIGSVQNRGLEFSITSRNFVGKNFRWTTDFNIARNINKVLDIGKSSPDQLSGGTNDTRIFIGQPIGVNYLVRFSHVDAADGRPVYLDANGIETKEWKESNRVIVGHVLPDAMGGFSNRFEYKNFDLSFLFSFVIGGNIYDASAKRQIGVVTDWNMRAEIFDRWRKPGDVATYPRLTMDPATYGLSSEWQYNTTMWLYDASYGRLKNLTIGYNIPLKETSRIKGLHVGFIATNLFTITKYPGLDPEIARDFENAQDRNMSPNVTYLSAPQQKAYSFAVNFQF